MRYEYIDRDKMRTMIGWMFDVPEDKIVLEDFSEFQCEWEEDEDIQ